MSTWKTEKEMKRSIEMNIRRYRLLIKWITIEVPTFRRKASPRYSGLKMEVICSSETLVIQPHTGLHNPEDNIPQNILVLKLHRKTAFGKPKSTCGGNIKLI
jgi:hypothetical protein